MKKIKPILLLSLLMVSMTGNSQNDTVSNFTTNIIKLNATKLLTNELAFSFEHRVINNAYDVEASYFYPIKNTTGNTTSVAIEYSGIPFMCHRGLALNLFLKHYSSHTLSDFYYGLSTLFKYAEFKNTWISEGRDYEGQYNVNCSQKRYVVGLAFRVGKLSSGKYLTFEKYAAVGYRLINCNTSYNYYKINEYGNTLYPGNPVNGTLKYDNGIYFFPFLNLGVKIGFILPKKK